MESGNRLLSELEDKPNMQIISGYYKLWNFIYYKGCARVYVHFVLLFCIKFEEKNLSKIRTEIRTENFLHIYKATHTHTLLLYIAMALFMGKYPF